MKTLAARTNGSSWYLALALACVISQRPATANGDQPPQNTNDQPCITHIWIEVEQSNIVVQCDVPVGLRKLTLESRTIAVAGAWIPRLVQRLDGTGGTVFFRLKPSANLEMLRVRAADQEPLATSFYSGTTNFNGQGTAYDPRYLGYMYMMDGLVPPPMAGAVADPSAAASAPRTVVESDIWQINGKTLYFFNQYRGLQIIDLTNVDSPVIKYSLELPASGEQMYLLNDHYVVLLTRNRNWNESEVVVVDVSAAPRIVSHLPVTGRISESRLVGTALYVVTEYYRQTTISSTNSAENGTTAWEWGSLVSSFDLADPQAAVARNPIWLAGSGNAIHATDRFLFACTTETINYRQSIVHIIDISAPNGVMSELTTLTTDGKVNNKFNMNLSGDIFSVTSEMSTTQRVSVLQTFSMAQSNAPVALGRLEVGHGEGLYATRFDGDRAYLVTFLRTDPLWVVDLRDPAHPTVSGELQVPGWSTFICPIGDRLVTIGIDNSNGWHVAVSLFDVADPTKPGLLSKVPMGDNPSWSEANSDEKALSVLPDAGLVLVPYQTWGTNGYAARVQLIDLNHDTLQARGVIEHSMQPRRATVYTNRILSISGRELLTVNAVDRDHPFVTSDLELSWTVDRVFSAGDFLITASDGTDWQNLPKPMLQVVSNTNPNDLLFTYAFTNGYSMLGATVNGGRLFVLQGDQSYGYYGYLPVDAAGGGESAPAEPLGKAVLSIFDLSALPQLQLVGQVSAGTPSLVSGTFTPIWPKNNLLVWAGSGSGYSPWSYWGGMYYPYPWRGSSGGRLLAFNIVQSTAPQFLSELNLQGTNSWWSLSQPQTAGGLVYFSHQGAEYLKDCTPSWYTRPNPVVTTNEDGTVVTNWPPAGIWMTRYFMDVVDYADPVTPTVRNKVSIPGALAGLSMNGAMVYTTGPHWTADGTSDGDNYLDAGAYDGVSVALLDSLKLTNSWPTPIVLADGKVLALQNNAAGSSLQTWEMSATTGRFSQLGSVQLNWQPSTWRMFDKLLVLQGYERFDLYDVTVPALPVYKNTGFPPGSVYPDLVNADGNLDHGMWMPLGDYGVFHIPTVTGP